MRAFAPHDMMSKYVIQEIKIRNLDKMELASEKGMKSEYTSQLCGKRGNGTADYWWVCQPCCYLGMT